MYQYCRKSSKRKLYEGSDSEEIDHTNLDVDYELKFMPKLIHNDPIDVERQNPKSFPANSLEKIVKKANLNNFELDQKQCATLGSYQSMKLTDDIRDVVIERLRNKKEFSYY